MRIPTELGIVGMARHFAGAVWRVVTAVFHRKQVWVGPKVRRERMDICLSCPSGDLMSGGSDGLAQCGLCGCVLAQKVKLATERCDNGFWAQVPTSADAGRVITVTDIWDAEGDLFCLMPSESETVGEILSMATVNFRIPRPMLSHRLTDGLAKAFLQDIVTVPESTYLRVRNILPPRPRLLLLNTIYTWDQLEEQRAEL